MIKRLEYQCGIFVSRGVFPKVGEVNLEANDGFRFGFDNVGSFGKGYFVSRISLPSLRRDMECAFAFLLSYPFSANPVL